MQEEIQLCQDWAEESELVFIVGPERSGTSLMFQQIIAHPDFCDFSNATVETFAFIKPWHLLHDSTRDNYEMRQYLKKGGLQKLLKILEPVVDVNLQLDHEGYPQDYLGRKNGDEIWESRQYSTVLQQFFYQSWLAHGKKRMVEKTPAHIRCVDKIMKTFPHAKIVVCLRDVEEIIASHRKRYLKEVELGKGPDSLKWLNKTTKEYCKYLKSVDTMVERMRSEAHINPLVVSYGELTKNPDKTMNMVFEYTGTKPFDSDKRESGPEVKTPEWDPLLKSKPQENIVDIGKYLTQEDLKLTGRLKSEISELWK